MREQQSGRIINISSVGGKFYEPLGAWYHATKFAVEGFSDSLRLELAPYGIRVVIVEPGPIRTEWNELARAHLRLEQRRYAVRAPGRGRARPDGGRRRPDDERPRRGRAQDRPGGHGAAAAHAATRSVAAPGPWSPPGGCCRTARMDAVISRLYS